MTISKAYQLQKQGTISEEFFHLSFIIEPKSELHRELNLFLHKAFKKLPSLQSAIVTDNKNVCLCLSLSKEKILYDAIAYMGVFSCLNLAVCSKNRTGYLIVNKPLVISHGCKKFQCQCNDSTCILERYICDGIVHCKNGEDKSNNYCTQFFKSENKNLVCGYHQMFCNGECINAALVCSFSNCTRDSFCNVYNAHKIDNSFPYMIGNVKTMFF